MSKKALAIYLLLVMCFITGTSFLSLPTEHTAIQDKEGVNPLDTFPVPPNKKNRIFYIQRTLNTNTVVYDLNYNKDSTLNTAEPVHAYWIRYADDGEARELSYIQKKYAYGVELMRMDSAQSIFKLNFVSYKKRDIFLTKSKSGHVYKACILINKKPAYLHRIFFRLDGGTFWVPHITYVQIIGSDIATGELISEKIIP